MLQISWILQYSPNFCILNEYKLTKKQKKSESCIVGHPVCLLLAIACHRYCLLNSKSMISISAGRCWPVALITAGDRSRREFIKQGPAYTPNTGQEDNNIRRGNYSVSCLR